MHKPGVAALVARAAAQESRADILTARGWLKSREKKHTMAKAYHHEAQEALSSAKHARRHLTSA